MKKFFALLLAVMMVFSLVACGANEATPAGEGAEEAPAAEPVVVQIGYENSVGEPIDLACNEWARLVAERSNGTLKIECYPSSQLGTKTELIDQMIAGMPVVTLCDGAFLAENGVPDFGILIAPYMFDTWDDYFKLVETDLYKGWVEEIAEKGNLQILTSNWIYGDRNLLTSKPVTCLADLKGMKIRTPSNNIQAQGMAVLGAIPTPMALGDVYTALQQGTIDGFEQPVAVMYAGKYYEAAKHLTITDHVKGGMVWICGTGFFDTLTEDQQQILMECGDEAGIFNNNEYNKQTDVAVESLQAAGVEVHEIDVNEFKEAAKAFYEMDEFTSIWSEGLYDSVMAAIGK